MDDVVAISDSMNDVISRMRGDHRCRCGAPLTYPGRCDTCGRRERREERGRLAANYLASVPARFSWAAPGAPELQSRIRRPAAIHEALTYAHDTSLVLLGETGSGKSTLAALVLNTWASMAIDGDERAMERIRTARWISTSDLTGDFGVPPDRDLLSRARTARVLVLDDVGAELDGAPVGSPLWAQRVRPVSDLMRARYDAGLRTIVTTWLGAADMATVYSAAAARRVYEGAQVIRCDAALARTTGAAA